jgi:hypothetical protein
LWLVSSRPFQPCEQGAQYSFKAKSSIHVAENTFVHHLHIFYGYKISWMMCNNAMLDYNGHYQLPNRPNAQDSGAHIQQCPPFCIIPRTPFQGIVLHDTTS